MTHRSELRILSIAFNLSRTWYKLSEIIITCVFFFCIICTVLLRIFVVDVYMWIFTKPAGKYFLDIVNVLLSEIRLY